MLLKSMPQDEVPNKSTQKSKDNNFPIKSFEHVSKVKYEWVAISFVKQAVSQVTVALHWLHNCTIYGQNHTFLLLYCICNSDFLRLLYEQVKSQKSNKKSRQQRSRMAEITRGERCGCMFKFYLIARYWMVIFSSSLSGDNVDTKEKPSQQPFLNYR